MTQQGRIRWHLDSRLVSYSIAVSSEYAEGKNNVVAYTTRLCAQAALQAAAGLAALKQACEAASDADAILPGEDGAKKDRVATVFRSLAGIIEAQAGELRDTFELICVLAENTNEQHPAMDNMRALARGMGLDLSELQVHEDSAIYADEAVKQAPERPMRKKGSARPAQLTKDLYRADRIRDLVTKCLAREIFYVRTGPLTGSLVPIEGRTASGWVELGRFRASMRDVKHVCKKANRELSSLKHTHRDILEENGLS